MHGQQKLKLKATQGFPIPVVGIRRRYNRAISLKKERRRVLTSIKRHQPCSPNADNGQWNIPSIYVLNAASLSKPGAVQQLAAEFKSHGTSVAIITETHLKKKHTDNIVSISDYTLYRRDRVGRRGGGVAVYVSAELQSSRWTPTITADRDLEIDWVRIGDRAFVAALYHPHVQHIARRCCWTLWRCACRKSRTTFRWLT